MQNDENFENELLDQLADIIEDNIIKDSKVINIGTVLVPSEKSNTKTHANECWMIEPEISFCDLDGLMDIEEEMLK